MLVFMGCNRMISLMFNFPFFLGRDGGMSFGVQPWAMLVSRHGGMASCSKVIPFTS